jgi:hypothetical protein
MKQSDKQIRVAIRLTPELKEQWQILCDLHSWNGSDKIRKYIEMLVADNIHSIEQERYRREQEKFIRERFKNNE